MLLRCCTAALLLLAVGCAQCFLDKVYDTFSGVVNILHDFESFVVGQKYSTRVTFKLLGPESGDEIVTGFTSLSVDAEGTLVSQVDVTFYKPMARSTFLRGENVQHFNVRRSWMLESPLRGNFWTGDWSSATHLSVHMYNKSCNQNEVSLVRSRNLTQLELTGNSWPTLELHMLLPKLKKLSLADNQIERLKEGMFTDFPNLEELDLSRNKIRSYSVVALSTVFNSREWEEYSWVIAIVDSLQDILLPKRQHIKKLNASYNQISSPNPFYIAKNSQVDLSFNYITEFPNSSYSFRVDRMILAGQNLSTLPEVGRILSNIDREMFEYFIANVELVYDNRTSVHRPELFLYVTVGECTLDGKIVYCNDNGSNIVPSPESTFINLAGNAVKIDKSSVFEIWPENLVDLSENDLKVLEDVPALISDTKHLNLSRNSIGYINRRLFENMTRLIVLDLSYNQLKHVQLILYSSLRMLDISNNCLNRMNISHSSSQFITEYLNLSHNSFTNILKAEWSQFDQFSKVDFGENYLQCCGPEALYSRIMLLHYQVKILNINSSKALTCVRPYYGRVEMTDTWLSEDHCQFNVQGWVGFGCLVLLLPLIIHGVDLIDYFMHQTERDLAEQLTRLKNQGLEQDENCALECQYDAFVCHSHKDARWVRYELLPNLENDRDGHRLCVHYRDFELGSFIEENVEEAMNTSRKVIVVVTRSFLQSNWCKMELTFAWEKMVREGRNYIIVIEVDRIPKGKRPPILSYLMRSRTYLEWPEAPTEDEKQHCWSRVRDALGKSLRDRHQEQQESGMAAFQMECEELHNG